MGIQERIQQERALAAEKARAASSTNPEPGLTYDELQRQRLKADLLNNVSSLKDLTGDGRARVEDDTSHSGHVTLVWDEQRVRKSLSQEQGQSRILSRKDIGDYTEEITAEHEVRHWECDQTEGRRVSIAIWDWEQAVSQGTQEDLLARKFVEEETSQEKSAYDFKPVKGSEKTILEVRTRTSSTRRSSEPGY